MFKIKQLVLSSLVFIHATGSAIDLTNFNAAFHNLKKWRSNVQVSKYTGYTTDSEGEETEVTLYKTTADNRDAQIALDNYQIEYRKLCDALAWRNLKIGAATGLATLAGTQLWSLTTNVPTSRTTQLGTIGALSALYSYGSYSATPETPYYTVPALEEADNIFASSNSHTLGAMMMQVVAASLVNLGGEALLSKIK